MPNLVSLTRPSLQIFGKIQIRISGQFFINENCHNSRASHDINVRLGPVTKLDKTNTGTSEKYDDDVMSANCDVIVFFSTYGESAAIRKPDTGCMIYKTYIFNNSNLLFNKT